MIKSDYIVLENIILRTPELNNNTYIGKATELNGDNEIQEVLVSGLNVKYRWNQRYNYRANQILKLSYEHK